jgi:hypothetical protein
MSHLKLLVLCTLGVLVLAQSAPAAQNLALNPGFETESGETGLVCASWTRTWTNSASNVQVTRLAGGGEAGSASLNLVTIGGEGATSSNNGAWQNVPVIPGYKYQVRGKWRGDVGVRPETGSYAVAEVYVGFTDSATARATSETSIYRKRNQYGSTNICNVDPNGGAWGWQDFSDSRNLGWDGGDTVIATANYMTVRVSMNTANQTGTGYVDFDNIVVRGCQAPLGAADLNSDCSIDFKDFSLIAANWLVCGVSPGSLCW